MKRLSLKRVLKKLDKCTKNLSIVVVHVKDGSNALVDMAEDFFKRLEKMEEIVKEATEDTQDKLRHKKIEELL
jgi:hypothetical protein